MILQRHGRSNLSGRPSVYRSRAADGDGIGGSRAEADGIGGAVTVRSLAGEALTANHRVETSYADNRFGWPADRQAAFQLESTYGTVKSHLPGTLRKEGSRRILTGTGADSGGRLTLISKSGSVRLVAD